MVGMTSLDSEIHLPFQLLPSRRRRPVRGAPSRKRIEQADGDRFDTFRVEDLRRRVDVLGDERRAVPCRRPRCARAPAGAGSAAPAPGERARDDPTGSRECRAGSPANRGSPRSVSRPTLAPFFSRIVLVATVEPCTNSAQSRSRARERQVELLGGEAQHAEHALAGIGRHRGRLEDAHRALGVAQHHVGEGAADIDANAPGGDEGDRGRGHARVIKLSVRNSRARARQIAARAASLQKTSAMDPHGTIGRSPGAVGRLVAGLMSDRHRFTDTPSVSAIGDWLQSVGFRPIPRAVRPAGDR